MADAKGAESWASLARRAGWANTSNIHVGMRAPSRHRLLTFATALAHDGLRQLAHSDVYWDEIVAIEPTGEKQVYDLTIPETHNFVANDICVHNTTFALNIAQHAALTHKIPVAIFSLETSKEQLVQRILCSEAQVDNPDHCFARDEQPGCRRQRMRRASLPGGGAGNVAGRQTQPGAETGLERDRSGLGEPAQRADSDAGFTGAGNSCG